MGSEKWEISCFMRGKCPILINHEPQKKNEGQAKVNVNSNRRGLVTHRGGLNGQHITSSETVTIPKHNRRVEPSLQLWCMKSLALKS